MKFIKRDLPLAMIKTAAKVSGNRSLMKNSQKLKKLIERELIISESFSHFIMNEWIFESQHVVEFMKQMTAEERIKFNIRWVPAQVVK